MNTHGTGASGAKHRIESTVQKCMLIGKSCAAYPFRFTAQALRMQQDASATLRSVDLGPGDRPRRGFARRAVPRLRSVGPG
jgi:hypothetical protein